jgi:hypothetical protein
VRSSTLGCAIFVGSAMACLPFCGGPFARLSTVGGSAGERLLRHSLAAALR